MCEFILLIKYALVYPWAVPFNQCQQGGALLESCLAMLLLSILFLPIASDSIKAIAETQNNHIRAIAIMQARAYLLIQHKPILKRSVNRRSYLFYWQKDQQSLIKGVVLSLQKQMDFTVCISWGNRHQWCWQHN